jgi:hypothetical protein
MSFMLAAYMTRGMVLENLNIQDEANAPSNAIKRVGILGFVTPD